MNEKLSWMRIRQEMDMFVTSITRNKIREEKIGNVTLKIHERRRGKWVKIASPDSEFPLRGKEHDIVYTIFDGVVERQRLGKMAKEQKIPMYELQNADET